MGLFTEKEKEYLQQQALGRLATSGKTGMPHVVPTGFHFDPETGNIKIGGHSYRGQDRLYIRHLKVNPNAAFVIDDLVTDPTWTRPGTDSPIRRRSTWTRLRSALDRTNPALGFVVGHRRRPVRRADSAA